MKKKKPHSKRYKGKKSGYNKAKKSKRTGLPKRRTGAGGR